MTGLSICCSDRHTSRYDSGATFLPRQWRHLPALTVAPMPRSGSKVSFRYFAATMSSSPKTYFLLIFLPYLFLVVIFHLQLQIPTNQLRRSRDGEGQRSLVGLNSNRPLAVESEFDKDSFHFRDLMLKDSNNEFYAAKNEHERALPVGPFGYGGDRFEPYHQVAAPKKADQSQMRLIKVSRTFQNGTRQVREMVRFFDRDSQRLDLEGASESVGLSDEAPPFDGSQNYSSNNVQWPLTDECRRYLAESDAEQLDVTSAFHYVGGVHITSAFLDDRLPDQPPFVRLISLMARGRKPDLYCHFRYTSPAAVNGSRTSYATEAALFYEMCENHNKEYGGWIVSCKVPSVFTDAGRHPCHVIVSDRRRHDGAASAGAAVAIPIYSTGPGPSAGGAADKLNFAICVPPLFGHIPSTTLVEFVELSRLLGADHVIFYAHQLTSAIRKVLEYYRDRGLATVINWRLPIRDKDIWYHGQLLAINDCLYRTMGRFSHVVFNDIDEFLVPHAHDTWHGMVRHLERAENRTRICGFSFQSAFFDPLVNSNGRILYDLESDLRTKVFSQVRTKVMVRPRRIFELGIHHISRPLLDRYAKETVSPAVAFVHHYRKCMMDFDPRMKCQVYARDESVSRYTPSLRHNVHETLWILKELDRLGRQNSIN